MRPEERTKLIKSICVHDEDSVKGFFFDYRFLSNFHLCNIKYEDIIYPSVENAYQAAKTIIVSERHRFRYLSPSAAKSEGRLLKLREDWESIKLSIMTTLNFEKYNRHPDLAALLRGTGNRYLEETNYWGDVYWGKCKCLGQNWLGQILMELRKELK